MGIVSIEDEKRVAAMVRKREERKWKRRGNEGGWKYPPIRETDHERILMGRRREVVLAMKC